MEEPGGLQSMGSLRVSRDWAASLSLFTFTQWRRKWQPTPVFLPLESQGWQSPLGFGLWGRTGSDTTEATSQQPQGFPGGASGEEPACQCRGRKGHGFHPWVGKIPWRRAQQPTLVLLSGESHGHRSLAGCSPWGHKESDRTEET